MGRQDRLFYALRWPGVVTAACFMLLVIWWILPRDLGGAAGLVGVIGFLPITFVSSVIHYFLAINFAAILLLTLPTVFPTQPAIAHKLTRIGPPARPMVLTFALMMAMLLTGLSITCLEIVDYWANIIYSTEFTTEETHLFRAGPGLALGMIYWAAGIALLGRLWKQGDTMTQLTRATRRLSISAMLLLIVAIIAHNYAMQRDPTLAPQGLGSYTGLVMGVSVLAWSLLVSAIRHCFIKPYHHALALNRPWQDQPLRRGRMSITFKLIYMMRRLMFTFVAIIMAVVFWLMMTDIFIRVPLGSLTMRYLSIVTGHWLLPDHGIRGIFGIYPATKLTHLLLSVAGVFLFLLSQYLFERPVRNTLASLTTLGRLSWPNAIGTAMPAAGLTTGGLSLALEHFGYWSQLIPLAGEVSDRRFAGVILEPAFWLAMPTLLASFIVWTLVMRWLKLPGVLFHRRTQILFTLFVAATILLFISGMVQSVSYGYGGQYWNRGTFTSLCMGTSITLWTFIPALRLIYAGQAFAAVHQPIHPDTAPENNNARMPKNPGVER